MAADNTEKDKKDNSFMMKLATLIVDKRKGFYLIFIVLCIFCVLSMNKVKVSAAAGTGAGSGGTVLFAEKNRQRKTGARCSFNIEKRTAVLPFCQYVQEAAVYCPRCRRQAYPAQPRQSFIWPEPKQRPRIENSGRAKP